MAFAVIFLGDIAGSPERARERNLALSGGQSQRGIWFILNARPLTELHCSYIINPFISWRSFDENISVQREN